MDDITSTFIRIVPALIVWVIGLILSIKMLRCSGTRPEKLLVVGCSLILLQTILRPFLRIMIDVWMNTEGMSRVSVAQMYGLFSIPSMVLSLAGFICLVMAFWITFKVKKPEVM